MRKKKVMNQITVRVPQGVNALQMLNVIKHYLGKAYPAHDILATVKHVEEIQPISTHYPRKFPYVADYPDEEDA